MCDNYVSIVNKQSIFVLDGSNYQLDLVISKCIKNYTIQWTSDLINYKINNNNFTFLAENSTLSAFIGSITTKVSVSINGTFVNSDIVTVIFQTVILLYKSLGSNKWWENIIIL